MNKQFFNSNPIFWKLILTLVSVQRCCVIEDDSRRFISASRYMIDYMGLCKQNLMEHWTKIINKQSYKSFSIINHKIPEKYKDTIAIPSRYLTYFPDFLVLNHNRASLKIDDKYSQDNTIIWLWLYTLGVALWNICERKRILRVVDRVGVNASYRAFVVFYILREFVCNNTLYDSLKNCIFPLHHPSLIDEFIEKSLKTYEFFHIHKLRDDEISIETLISG